MLLGTGVGSAFLQDECSRPLRQDSHGVPTERPCIQRVLSSPAGGKGPGWCELWMSYTWQPLVSAISPKSLLESHPHGWDTGHSGNDSSGEARHRMLGLLFCLPPSSLVFCPASSSHLSLPKL